MTIKLYDFNGNLMSQQVHEDFATDWSNCFNGILVDDSIGGISYYTNGCLHRIDGPAAEYTDGTKCWFVDGKLVTELQCKCLYDIMKLKGLL